MTDPQRSEGLAVLELRLRHELDLLELPAAPWVPSRATEGGLATDVVVIGAGMAGLAVAAKLRLFGVERVRVLDRAPAGQEGPWVTFARMRTLRSSKLHAGPALQLPSLTFRAWFEAQFGADAWSSLGKAPRPLWMDYLRWFRRVMRVEVGNDCRVTLIRPREDGLLAIEHTGGPTIACRRVVLATGRDGLGGPAIPRFAAALPRHLWSHASEAIDFAALRGRRVAVVGAGASAMDNAAAALEAGCASLDMLVRRAAVPSDDIGTGFPGMIHGFASLPDEWKWRLMHLQLVVQNPPPRESVLRVFRHPQARLHVASPIEAAEPAGDALRLVAPQGAMIVDHLILGTGFRVDLSERPELARLAPHVAFWRDRPEVAGWHANEELLDSPDLAPDYAFRERQPGACPMLRHIHCFNYAATLSHGKLSGDVRDVSHGVERLARGLIASLFAEDVEHHARALPLSAKAELLGDECQSSDDLRQAALLPVRRRIV